MSDISQKVPHRTVCNYNVYVSCFNKSNIYTVCQQRSGETSRWYAGGRWFETSWNAYATFLFFLVCTSTYLYVPVHTGISKYIPVCTSTYRYVPRHSGMYQYIHVCPGIYQYVTVHTCIDSVHHCTNQVQESMYSILTRITQYAPLPLAKLYQSPWANTMYINLV